MSPDTANDAKLFASSLCLEDDHRPEANLP
jgi:hypothetical protein